MSSFYYKYSVLYYAHHLFLENVQFFQHNISFMTCILMPIPVLLYCVLLYYSSIGA